MHRNLKNMMQLLPSSIVVWDRCGQITCVNEALERMFAYPCDELIGQDIDVLFSPSTNSNAIDSLKSHNEDLDAPADNKRDNVLSAIKKDGREFKVELSVRVPENNSSEWLACVNDVTERESALESLALSQSINKTATWSFDLTSDVVLWSPELFRIFELPVADHAPPYEVHHTLFTPEAWEKLEPAVAAASEKGVPYELELELTSKSQKPRFAVARCEPQLDENGKVKRLVGTFQDVSTLKKAEIELQETALRLEESISAGRVGIWNWDLVTNNVYFSPEYKQQLGFAPDELDSSLEVWQSRIHPDDKESTLKAVSASIEKLAKNHEVVFRMRHKNGSYRWIMAHASIFQNKQGTPIRMLGAHIDITEQKKLESQLSQSHKMEAVGQLAGGIAHDFNNQLASILGFAELVESSNDIQKIKAYIKKIIASAEHSGNLIRQLMAFSRKENIKHERVDIHQLLTQTGELLGFSIDKRIKLQINLNANQFMTTGDTSLLYNAFVNLGINARDSMPNGGSLVISTTFLAQIDPALINYYKQVQQGPFILIEFKDTGCGIAEDNISKIFEPFFTTKKAGEGTGLGLASLYRVVEQLGGAVEVNSEVGVGSNFQIYLPLINAAELPSETTSSEVPKANVSKTILMADDEPRIREVVKDFLLSQGHRGLFASDGDEATKLYANHWQEIDLVILDMIMPEVNGEEAFQAIKRINPDVKVVIASGFTADNSSSDLLAKGVAKVVGKPFKLAELKDCIEELTG